MCLAFYNYMRYMKLLLRKPWAACLRLRYMTIMDFTCFAQVTSYRLTRLFSTINSYLHKAISLFIPVFPTPSCPSTAIRIVLGPVWLLSFRLFFMACLVVSFSVESDRVEQMTRYFTSKRPVINFSYKTSGISILLVTARGYIPPTWNLPTV